MASISLGSIASRCASHEPVRASVERRWSRSLLAMPERAHRDPNKLVAMSRENVREELKRDLDVAEYHEIRELWKKHSIAEDERDLPGLISTLTPDCVYELPSQAMSGRATKAPPASTPGLSVRSRTSTSS